MSVKLCPSVQIPVRRKSLKFSIFFTPVVTMIILGAREKRHLEISFRVPKMLLLQIFGLDL
jgi:hypothetical protein